MAVNKVVYDNNTLIDLTNDTVTPQTLAAGATAHAADGSVITGVAPTTAVLYTAQTLSSAQQQQARDNIGIDVVSAHHSWSGTTLTITSASGTSSADLKGADGATGQRGTGILKITTAPSGYTTATGGFTPTYRASLSTVKTQSKVNEVLVGDVIQYSYYQYPVGYVDASYVYTGARTSIRGAAGTAGTNGTDGASATITGATATVDANTGTPSVTVTAGGTELARSFTFAFKNLKGAKGDKGASPVRGVDYWTDADKEYIIQQVLAILNPQTSGTIDVVWNVGYTIDGTTGAVSQTSFTWGSSGVVHASEPIELASGRTYRLTTENARYTIVMAYYYKADGTYISRETVWDTRSATIVSAQNIALNLPANTGLVRFRATGSTTTNQTSEIITTVKPVVAWEVS